MVIDEFQRALDSWSEKSGDLRARDPKTIYSDEVVSSPSDEGQNYEVRGIIEQDELLIPKEGRFVVVSCNW